MCLKAEQLAIVPMQGLDVDITSPLNNQTYQCRVFKVGPYYMVAIRSTYEDLLSKQAAHYEATRARALRGGGIPTVDPDFPEHDRIVQYMRGFNGMIVHDKRELLEIVKNGQFTFSIVKLSK